MASRHAGLLICTDAVCRSCSAHPMKQGLTCMCHRHVCGAFVTSGFCILSTMDDVSSDKVCCALHVLCCVSCVGWQVSWWVVHVPLCLGRRVHPSAKPRRATKEGQWVLRPPLHIRALVFATVCHVVLRPLSPHFVASLGVAYSVLHTFLLNMFTLHGLMLCVVMLAIIILQHTYHYMCYS